MQWRVAAFGAVGVAGLVAAGWWAQGYLASAAFLLDLTGQTTGLRAWLPVRLHDVTARDTEIPTRHGPMAARLYTPAAAVARSVLVFPGVHGGGLDEPRLATFGRRLASTGTRVVTAPLPDLRAFRIVPRATDMAEDAMRWMAADRDLAPSGRIGVAGVSFAGGLALVAAGRPALAGKVDYLVSLGGHGSLPGVIAYLCSGVTSEGRRLPAHDYGVVVLLLAAADLLVPAGEVAGFRRAIELELELASITDADPRRPAAAAAATEAGRMLGPESAAIYREVRAREAAALGRRLQALAPALGRDAALSPLAAPPPRGVPIFLLHGADDNLIPSSEAAVLAAYLLENGAGPVRTLVTPLVSHADVRADAPLGDTWRLVRFWRHVIDR